MYVQGSRLLQVFTIEDQFHFLIFSIPLQYVGHAYNHA